MLRATCSSIALSWAEAAQPSRVLEYVVSYVQAEERHSAHSTMHVSSLRPGGEGGAGRRSATRIELTRLHSGTNYSVSVRAKTAEGLGPPSEALAARTMRPADFPVPLLPPTVAQAEGCTAVRLQLPVLSTCEAEPRAEWDLEVARDGTDDWRVLVADTVGGLVSAVGLDPYGTARFRLTSRTPSPSRPGPRVSSGATSPPVLAGPPLGKPLSPPLPRPLAWSFHS